MPKVIGGSSQNGGGRWGWCKGLREDLRKYAFCAGAERRGADNEGTSVAQGKGREGWQQPRPATGLGKLTQHLASLVSPLAKNEVRVDEL